jgi:hypothetical protein
MKKIVLFLAFSCFSAAAMAVADIQPSPDYFPPAELAFIAAVQKAQEAYVVAPNEFQRGALRPFRAPAICSALGGRLAAAQWTGRIVELSTNGDGKGVLAIEIAPHIVLRTWNNSFSDLMDHTLIEPGSRIYQAMMGLRKGQWVGFNASFFHAENDCVKEGSVSLGGSLESPDFIVRFFDVGTPQQYADARQVSGQTSPSSEQIYVPPPHQHYPVTPCGGTLATIGRDDIGAIEVCITPR